MRNLSLIILFVLVEPISHLKAQDIHFSQLPFAPLALNPALAGANFTNQASIVYRDQWKSAEAQFKTTYAGYDQRFVSKNKNGFLAGGVSFFSDKAGDSRMTTNYAGAVVAYHVKLNSHQTLGLGIQPAFGQRSVDLSALRWGKQYDGNGYNSNLPNGEANINFNSKSYFDLNTGIVYTFRNSEHYMTANDHKLINIGYSVFHLTRPKYSFFGLESERLYVKHVFFANAQIGLNNSRLSLMPGLYTLIQGPHKEFLMGTYFRYSLQDKSVYTGLKKGSALSFGGFYRLGDSFSAKCLIDYGPFSFGFAYDINVSSLTAVSRGRGAFEMVIRFVSPNPFGGARSVKSMM